MRYRFSAPAIAILALLLFGSVSPAHAIIIGATPNTSFADSSTTFSIGDASYTLFNDSTQRDQLSVATSGSAQVSLFGTPPNRPIQPGGIRGGVSLPTRDSALGPIDFSFASFEDPASVPSFNFFGPFLGLQFLLDDGIHFGYAEIGNSNTLLSFAYNSVVGEGIVTGAPIDAGLPPVDVPEPSTLALFALALGLLGFGAARTRRGPGAAMALPIR